MRRLGAVGIVMIGLWSLVGTVTFIGSTFSLLQTGSGGSLDRLAVAVNLLSILVSAVVGVALIMGRDRLASRWFDDSEVGISVESVDLLRVGLVLTGLFLIIDGVQNAFFSATNAIIQVSSLGSLLDSGVGRLGLWVSNLAGAGFGLVRILVGWLVIYYSARLAAFLWGLSPKPGVAKPAVPALDPVSSCPECGHGYDPADYRDGVERRCVECHASIDRDDA